ncbi:hypothetical protein L226DRAFT_346944 [Lentinus tigrinus ALCF2SS1-7]|uniref:uncharacterized protein n=1 Tax=Lentinus tigrinus ALCF2SS1-7 TaxID=1328758 RepID=UPI0011663682|nr:hypothetical protein L226DRAFT_346944 [Lentinus tigrinus ALCF2SS1-7]
MSTAFSNAALQEADAAIQAIQTHQPSKAEKRLNAIGNAVSRASGSSLVSIAQSDAATQVLSIVKDQVSNFAQNSKVLMNVLDELGKAHPFIQIAVSIFKAALTLELTRRENDEKVIALNLTMCDMMETLKLLNQVVNVKEPGPDGLSIEDRLKKRLGSIIDSIKRCAKVCDSYQKRPTAVKFFTSTKWQGKFTQVAQQFADHKAGIQFDLQIHASIGITTANVTLTAMSTSFTELNENVSKLMEVVFERMRTPEERDLSALVAKEAGGIDAVLKNDKLLEDVLAKQKAGPGKDKDEKGTKKRAVPGQTPDAVLTVTDLRKEVNKDVEQVLADNKFFDQKFEAMKMQVDEVKVEIRHESDRVIDTILAGPHERIVDRDLYHVWKEMGWKGSVKAKHLVMALRDHFAEGSHAALAAIRVITQEKKDGIDPAAAAQAMEEIADIANRTDPHASPGDEWALQFITVLRIQPLIEALDDDVSSFVTIAEANAFTAARPQKWSLPHWIAYWTYGFEMTVQWYFRRIRKIIGDFISSWHVRWIEDFLSGLRDVEQWDSTDWESDVMFMKFKDYVVENERNIEHNLRGVNYYLDEANTLSIVAGNGRPEKYVMPLVFILLRRSLYIVQQAHTVTLHMGELAVIQYSLSTLTDAIWDRVRTLQAVHKLQNLDDKEQMKKFFFGLYSFVFEEPEMSDYWKRDPDDDANMVNDVPPIPPAPTSDGDSELQQGDLPLFYEPTTEDIDLIVDPIFDDPTSPHPVAHFLIGHWSGSYAYDDQDGDGDGRVSFTVSYHDVNGAIIASGTDAFGPYVVQGTLDNDRLTFVKEYLLPQYGQKVMWRYEGVVSPDSNEIRGQWGPTDVDWKLVVYGEESEQETGAEEASGDVPAQQPEVGETATSAEGNATPAEENVNSAAEVPEIRADEAEDTHSSEDANEDHDDDGASDTGTAVSGMTAGFTHGTFFLTRRPVEYLLSCPSDEEFTANRPRALWKLALNATLRAMQSRTLSWGRLSARRKQRQQYVEILLQKRRQPGPWRGQDVEEAQEWTQLIKGIHPDDLHLWRCIATYQLRRDVIHDIVCDACGEYPITPRFTCMNCSEDEAYHTFDLCIKCFSANRQATRDNKVHSPTHNVVQYRNAKWRVYLHPYFDRARRMLKWAEDQLQLFQARSAVQTAVGDANSSGLWCVMCKFSITAPPYWCCLTCIEDSVVCYVCNERMEREKEWLYLRGTSAPNDTSQHNWSHTLVSAPGPEVITAETDQEKAMTVEERMARVEAKLDATNLKLAALEDLLRAVLARS